MQSKIEIGFNDLPQWVRRIVAAELGSKRPRAYVHFGDEFEFTCPWHEACRRSYWGRKDGRVEHIGTVSGNCGFASPAEEQTLFKGGTVRIGQGQVLVTVETYPASVDVYMHHLDGGIALPPETPALDEFDAAILDLLVGYTSAGRKDTYSRYGVPKAQVEAAYQRLADLGLAKIARNGAVGATLAGRQTRDRMKDGKTSDPGQYFYRRWAERTR